MLLSRLMKKVGTAVLAFIGIAVIFYIAIALFSGNRAIVSYAESSNNTDACRILNYIVSLEVSPGYSLSDCYTKVGIKNSNPDACALVPGGSNGYCYEQVAKNSGNISLCERIGASDLSRGGCYEAFVQTKADISICRGLTEPNSRSACYMYYVINVEPNASICEQNVQQGHNNYKDHCYYAAATAQKDVALCDRITFDYDKTNCKAQIFNSR